MQVVGRHMNSLEIPYAFLGASVLSLLVDNPDILDIRPTLDIDLTIQIATLADFYLLEERLRRIGFRNDTREGAPICRWVIETVTVDIMPTETSVLGMTSEWFPEAVEHANLIDLGHNIRAPIIGRPYFLATKLTAYRDRGANDPYMSKDLEDIVTLLDGCEDTAGLWAEAPSNLQKFIAEQLSTHLENREFTDAVAGCFRTDATSRHRAEIVLARFRALAVK